MHCCGGEFPCRCVVAWPGERAGPVRRCLAVRPGKRAGPGQSGVRSGSQPSRRDSPDETGTGGQPGTGLLIKLYRFCLEADGRRGASAALPREGASRPEPLPGIEASPSLAERARCSGVTPWPAAPLGIPGNRVLGAGRSDRVDLHPACQEHAARAFRSVPAARFTGRDARSHSY